MSAPPLLNAAGRRRSPVTLPGYLAGRRPRNKGLRYPPDPPTVEAVVAVMAPGRRRCPRRAHASTDRAALAGRAAHQRGADRDRARDSWSSRPTAAASAPAGSPGCPSVSSECASPRRRAQREGSVTASPACRAIASARKSAPRARVAGCRPGQDLPLARRAGLHARGLRPGGHPGAGAPSSPHGGGKDSG
jgi:hypothetical protein